MSVSMKSTKAQMYGEIERLRLLCDRLDQQLKAAQAAAYVRQPLNTHMTLPEFCSSYCEHFGVRSVPGDVVKAFRAGTYNMQQLS